MKKAIYFILVLIFLNSVYVFCSTPDTIKSKIELIEQETNTYGGENISVEERIKNAEKYVFGISKTGDLNKRANELGKVLGISFEDKKSKEETTAYEFQEDTNANYPAIDKMEKMAFGKTFSNENVYARLERLEKKAFGKVSNSSLYERVDNLSVKLSASNPSAAAPIENFTQPHPNKNITKNNDYAYYSPRTTNTNELSVIEKKLFKKSYDGESVSSRLSRVENKIFNQQFNNDSDSTRLDRIYAVHKAAKSGTEYKVNKFAKYAATGIQVGGIILLILAMIL